MVDFELIKCCLLDLDGTVYLGKNLIDGAAEAIARMRKKGKRVVFVTNNSSRSKEEYLAKLRGMGLSVSAEEMYTSGLSTLIYLNEYHKGKSVFLLGTESLKNEFVSTGVRLSEESAGIVVIAFDTTLEYKSLSKACSLISAGAFFVATHPDLTCPMDGGSIPDVGSFLALIKAATGREPDVICGKPYPAFARGLSSFTGFGAAETAMFGDRLMTDMRFAASNGFKAVLVLSGEATEAGLRESGLKADLVLPSIAFWDK